MDLKARVKEILEKTHLMSIATYDDGGVWVSDVIFVYDDDLNVYWMSDPDVRHSQAISKNTSVAGTITYTTKANEHNLGIQFSGIAKKIDGTRYDLAVKHSTKRNHPEPKESDDFLQGDSWYMLTPNKIELIDEENFGFKKQSV